ncbi:MAG TPA: PilZ domain-containing protein [Roseiarcus sp.]|nr:PilZ domain-containing protein [Roseiarcus sp.]
MIAGAAPLVDVKPLERRRHQRVKIVLLGRYMLEDRHEYPCRTIDISPGGVAIEGAVKGHIGERVVGYFTQIGRIEGVVARHFDKGFAIQMRLPVLKREKLAEQLTWLVNRQALGLPEDRRHERITPHFTRTTLKTPDGQEHAARLVDISISGAAMNVEASPAIGSPVVVGDTAAQVVRHFSGGVAVEFARLLSADTFDENTRL